MLRIFLRRHPNLFSFASNWCLRPKQLGLIHDQVPKTLDPSFSDFTISYLVKSCGLSPGAALSVAKNFSFKTKATTRNADSLLSLLRSHGCTQRQIADIVTRYPPLLTFNPEKIIKPKLEFLIGLGYSGDDVVKLITSDIYILKSSLEKRIRPNYNMLKGILGTHSKVTIAIGNSSQLLQQNLDRYMLPNIKTLKDLGVPENKIVKLATLYPRSLLKNPAQFSKTIELLKKMGFDISKTVFTLGVYVLSVLCKATWDRKFQLYRSLGWSEEDIFTAFKKHPFSMLLSEEKIKQNFGFFAKELKWAPSFVAARPVLLFFSFDNTIMPRYKIFRILESKGLMRRRRNGGFSAVLWLTKEKFLNQYVIKFADRVPELLELYKDKLQLPIVKADS